jgi:hypothetical protein
MIPLREAASHYANPGSTAKRFSCPLAISPLGYGNSSVKLSVRPSHASLVLFSSNRVRATACLLAMEGTTAPLKDETLLIEPLGVEVHKSGHVYPPFPTNKTS